jgi:hypothetical protein
MTIHRCREQEFEMDIYVFEMDKIKRQIKQLLEHLK